MEQLQRLSRFFLRKCDHEDPGTAALAYDLFQLCHEENATFAQVMELVGPGADRPGQTKPREKRRGLFSRRRGAAADPQNG